MERFLTNLLDCNAGKGKIFVCFLLEMWGLDTSISETCFSIVMQSMICGIWRGSTNVECSRVRYCDT